MARQVTGLTALAVAVGVTSMAAPVFGVDARQAATAPQCVSVDFSPDLATGRKGFCLAFDPSDGDDSTFRFFGSFDGGRTWERRAATGFTPRQDEIMGSVIVSPGYANDGTVFVQSSSGVYSTIDDGASFALVDNFAVTGPSGPNLSAFVEDAVGLPGSAEGERPVLALAAGDSSVKIDPPHRVPVTGAPFSERRFFFPAHPDGDRLAYTMTVEIDNTQGVTSRSRNILFRCNEQLVCAEQLFAFPWGYQFEPRGGLWFASDFPLSGRVYMTTSKVRQGSSSLRAFRSKDGGATFRPWDSVNQMLRPLRKLEASTPTIGLASHPARPRTIYMRLGYRLPFDAKGQPPIERFFVSRDRGRTWDLLSFARDEDQPGRRGTIPWNGTWGYPVSNYVAAMDDGTLFVMASDLGGHSGLYCSTDGGRTWAPTCPSR